MERENPFVPIPGRTPPDLIGRGEILEHFSNALTQRNSPYRLTRVSGIRGMGKTALLARLRRLAREADWFVYDDEARETSDVSLARELQRALDRPHRKLVSEATIDLGPVHLTSKSRDAAKEDDHRLRPVLEEFMGQAGDLGFKGLAILLDEVQDADIDALRRLATAVQRVSDEYPDIVFVFAGLPSMIGSVVDAPSLTFLRRAMPEVLGELPTSEVMASMGATIEASGLSIEPDALVRLAESSDGYPYLIQLAGYFAWDAAAKREADTHTITLSDVERAVVVAHKRFEETVIEPVLTRLNDRGIDYLLAMAESGPVVATREVAEALNASQKSLSVTRAQLLREQVIENPRRGYVAFAIPGMRSYLEVHRDELGR